MQAVADNLGYMLVSEENGEPNLQEKNTNLLQQDE